MRAVDLSGRVFGKWTVVERSARRAYWVCRCKCGTEKDVFHGHLVAGKSKSCGCYEGLTQHPLYSVWHGIKVRCYTITAPIYRYYGGRGIGMHRSWRNDFRAFREWALRTGWQSGLTIERIDVNKGYTPSNCLWVPLAEQPHNRRNTIRVMWEGKQVALAKLARYYGHPYQRVFKRLHRGWSLEKALLTESLR